MSADHVYRLDFNEVLEAHRRQQAECTVVTTEVPLSEAGDHATVEVEDGRVVGFDYKPDEPTTGVIATEVFAYDPAVLAEVLDELHRELGEEAEAGDTGLEDFGDHCCRGWSSAGKTFAHPSTATGATSASRITTSGRTVTCCGTTWVCWTSPGWPILTHQPQRAPARILEGAEVTDSLVSPGSKVAGQVRRSVLGPGVVVEADACVEDSVVFADCVIRSGARVNASIIDTRCVVEAGSTVGSAGGRPRVQRPADARGARLRHRRGRHGARRRPARAGYDGLSGQPTSEPRRAAERRRWRWKRSRRSRRTSRESCWWAPGWSISRLSTW